MQGRVIVTFISLQKLGIILTQHERRRLLLSGVRTLVIIQFVHRESR